MSSFYDVVSGNTTMAADINQYADRFNGSVGAQITVLAPTNALTPITAQLPSAPTSDLGLLHGQVSGDAFARVSAYIRSADGYGGFKAGAGVGAQTAHLYAQANGWRTDESLAIGGALNVTGTTTLAGVNAGTINGGSINASGVSTFGSNLYANAGLIARPFSNDDVFQLYDRNGVASLNIGYAQGGGGAYLYDIVHGGFIFLNATTAGMTINGRMTAASLTTDGGQITTNGSGALTVPQILGAISVDVESGQSVFRPGTGGINIVIQVAGHNWVFRNDGKLITPSGATIS